jgi:hypothetical protein
MEESIEESLLRVIDFSNQDKLNFKNSVSYRKKV